MSDYIYDLWLSVRVHTLIIAYFTTRARVLYLLRQRIRIGGRKLYYSTRGRDINYWAHVFRERGNIRFL